MPARNQPAVRTALLDTAQKLFQQRGYNAVSYYDLSRQVGVTTATIHYYFPTKADLASAVTERYTAGLREELERIKASTAEPLDRLIQFSEIFRATYSDEGRLCLGGMFAADLATLPPPTQEALRAFFSVAEQWLAAVVEEGAQSGRLQPSAPPPQVAQSVLALLEGGMLITRTFDDTRRFDACAVGLRALVGAPTT
jgi:TetR/AcrR family transcriptional repressor of nem operon